MTAPVVRRAACGDLDAVNRVRADASREPLSALNWRQMIADESQVVFVCEVERAVAGWAGTRYFEKADGVAGAGHYLAGITVAPAHRRRGLGRALIAARLAWIAERAGTAWYFANARNTASVRAHAEFGFVEVGRAEAFHGVTFDGGEGIVFRADL